MKMRRPLPLVLVAAALLPAGLEAQQAVVYATPLSAITLAAASAPVLQTGQAMHVLKIEFPTAGGAVSPIQVRVEASYDASVWVPIGPDVTSVPSLTGGVYAFEKYYGVFPFIRVRSVVNVPGGAGSMTVRYWGHMLPIVPFLSLLADRYSF